MNKDNKVMQNSFFKTLVDGFKKGELVSYQRVIGDNGSIEVSSQSVTFGEETYSYDKQIRVSVGDSEDGNSSGQAISTVSMDGKNEIRTIQIGSGRVSAKDLADYKIGIKNKINEIVNDDWRVQIKVHTQSEEPKEYFDLILIKRNGNQRNPATDPHITFRPDGSGKFIRFGPYSNNSEIKTLSESEIGGMLLPSLTEVKFDNAIITISYLFEESVFYIDKVEIK